MVNSVAAKNSSKMKVYGNGDLMLHNVSDSDAGSYKCMAMNIKAIIEDSTDVKVVGELLQVSKT